MRGVKLVESPPLESLLDFCASDPIERVFIEDVARRGLGRFLAVEEGGRLVGLCHVAADALPSGRGAEPFARATERAQPRMISGDERPVAELWQAVAKKLPPPREDRPGQPVYAIDVA